jgi:hypothetical protein
MVGGYPGEPVWISGGIALERLVFRPCWSNNTNILVADLSPPLLKTKPLFPKVVSLFTTNPSSLHSCSLYPNADPEDPEVDQWGYASHHRLLDYSSSCSRYCERMAQASRWLVRLPNFTLVDFRTDRPTSWRSCQEQFGPTRIQLVVCQCWSWRSM